MLTALGGRCDFPVAGRCLHGEAKHTRSQVPFSTPLGEGGEMPGTAHQRSWGWMLPTAVPHRQRMQNPVRLVRLAPGAAPWGLLSWVPPAGRSSLQQIPPLGETCCLGSSHTWLHLLQESSFFPLATVPLGRAGPINFSEVLEAGIFAAAVNSVLVGEVLLVPFPPPFLLLYLPALSSFLK